MPACAKLVEIFGDLNFGIDRWFVRNPGLFGAVPTGRMAPMTAINFLFIGTGLLALTGKQPAKFAGPLGALAAVIDAVVLVGYWYELAVAGVRGGRTAELVLARAVATSSWGAVTTQNVLLVTGENIEMRS